MDATAIAKIIESRDLIALVVLLGFVAVPLAKGMHAVVQGRDQRRKEFLELWTQKEHHKDDLWIEGIVKHGYGVSLSPDMIRHVTSLDRPALKLRRLAMASEFFEFDAKRGRVAWAKSWRRHFRWLMVEVLVYAVAYILLSSVGVALIIAGSKLRSPGDAASIFWGLMVCFLAAASFWRLISVVEARSAMKVISA